MFQPPTDNLYKFIAISGLILLLGGGIFPYMKSIELTQELIEFSGEAKKLKLEADMTALKTEISKLQIKKTFKIAAHKPKSRRI